MKTVPDGRRPRQPPLLGNERGCEYNLAGDEEVRAFGGSEQVFIHVTDVRQEQGPDQVLGSGSRVRDSPQHLQLVRGQGRPRRTAFQSRGFELRAIELARGKEHPVDVAPAGPKPVP